MALRHPGVSVEAITVVGGNVPVAQGVQNALYTVERCRRAVPVHRGCAQPLTRRLVTVEEIHGADGLGDVGLPLRDRAPAPTPAVAAIQEVVDRVGPDLTVVTLGPLTNLALALLADPTLASRVGRCVVMGGTGRGPGNVTPAAEYNVWVDPEAAAIVLAAGLPLTLVGWDVAARRAIFDEADGAALRALATPLAAFCVDIQRQQVAFNTAQSGRAVFTLPDPITMAVALDPAVATESADRYVAVETAGVVARGQTVVDHEGIAQRPANARVVFDADRDRFLDLLHRAVAADP